MNTFDWTVVSVRPREDYTLKIRFADGSLRLFDMKPFLESPVFGPLRDLDTFMMARVEFDTVVWDGEIDIAPERLYEDSAILTG